MLIKKCKFVDPMVKLFVKDIIGSPTAVSPKKGLLVYERIKPLLERHEHVNLSFAGVEDLVTAFSNALFGNLYSELPKPLLDSNLVLENVNDVWMSKINLAILLATNSTARDTHAKNIDELLQS
jgi:hypothetical protein